MGQPQDSCLRLNRNDDQSLSIIAGDGNVCLVNIAQLAVVTGRVHVTGHYGAIVRACCDAEQN